MSRKTIPTDTNTIAKLYIEKKLTLRQIAARFGVSCQAIHLRLRNEGFNRRQKGRRLTDVDPQIVDALMKDEGLTRREVAARLNTPYAAVTRALRSKHTGMSNGYICRRYPALNRLKPGENVIVSNLNAKQYQYRQFYAIAIKLGIRISIKTLDRSTIKINRIK